MGLSEIWAFISRSLGPYIILNHKTACNCRERYLFMYIYVTCINMCGGARDPRLAVIIAWLIGAVR